KMMSSFLNTNMVGGQHFAPTGYITNAAMLDELSRQLATASNSRRYSKGSSNQRAGNMGTAMRITKPGSASNSPRSSGYHARRKTLVGEGNQRPHLQPVDMSYLPAPTAAVSREFAYEPETRPARPVSWHPSSQQQQQQQQQQIQHASQLQHPQQMTMGYPFPNFTDAELFPSYQQFPPTPIAYSGYASPASTFSPLSLPYASVGSQQYQSPAIQAMPNQQLQQQCSQTYNSMQHSGSSTAVSSAEMPYLPAPKLTVTGGSLDWEAFRAHGFDKYAAPPTPEDYVSRPPLPMAAMKAEVSIGATKVANEDAMPFPALLDDEDESEGEILYGMGLYDEPDRDTVATLHRSTVLSLLGGAYPEPTGKGLKLEDAWEPPVSDEEDGGDEEEDAEGDDC
ncbi:hypothetical protein B0T18DRAFT_320364, partial [Schizothecium vesticola]